MRSISARLTALEKAQHSNGLVTAVFADGSTRRLPLPDTIPLLGNDTIVDVIGDGGQRCGQLAALIRGLLEPPEMEVEF